MIFSRKYNYTKLLLLKCFLVISYIYISECQAQQDSINYKPIKDSLSADTTVKSTGDIDAIIEYSAKDSAIFDITNNKLFLYNDGYVKYKEFELHAARIILYKDTQI